jgi:CRISPR-associated protein Cmr6
MEQPKPIIPLPESTRALLDQVLGDDDRIKDVHPGLLLDKFSAICIRDWKINQDGDEHDDRGNTIDETKFQKFQRVAIERVKKASLSFSNTIINTASKRRSEYFQHLIKINKMEVISCQTISPLTIDLSHPSSLENAGIGLHPLYGFLYLPGSSLKGMTRAYAETLWLPHEKDKKMAEDKILTIFGNDPDEHEEDEFHAGAVIFHDAFPENPPPLEVDVVSNHHKSYYDNKNAPGDWEDPVMVFFLCIKEGINFEFAVSLNPPHKDQTLLTQAKEWLLGALCHLGAGAKTSAGYGYFYPVHDKAPISPREKWDINQTGKGLFEVEIELDLITPAFLGDAYKNASPVLRLSSLDGILRKWWRAWHPDLTIEELHKKESDTFGSIDTGVQLSFAPSFSGLHKINTDNIRTGQEMKPWERSLAYLGFGPIEYKKTKSAIWFDQRLSFRIFHNSYQAMEEILKSLWLLCAIGGIGSRNRRGWGSIMLKGEISNQLGLSNLQECKSLKEYENKIWEGLEILISKKRRKSASDLGWTALGRDMDIIISPQLFTEGKEALIDIGNKFQDFRSKNNKGRRDHDNTIMYFDAQLFGNDEEKENAVLPIPERTAFGMPYTQAFTSLREKLENIQGEEIRKSPAITFTPEWKENNKITTGRRASPIFFKIVKLDTKPEQFLWQVVYLPSRFLPEGAKIKVEGTYLKKKEFINPPMEYGVPQNPENPKDTLIRDFLTWLKGNPDVPEIIPRVTSVPPSGKVRDNHPKSNFSNKLDTSELSKKLKKQ